MKLKIFILCLAMALPLLAGCSSFRFKATSEPYAAEAKAQKEERLPD